MLFTCTVETKTILRRITAVYTIVREKKNKHRNYIL